MRILQRICRRVPRQEDRRIRRHSHLAIWDSSGLVGCTKGLEWGSVGKAMMQKEEAVGSEREAASFRRYRLWLL